MEAERLLMITKERCDICEIKNLKMASWIFNIRCNFLPHRYAGRQADDPVLHLKSGNILNNELQR